jgi:hypothetical protein
LEEGLARGHDPVVAAAALPAVCRQRLGHAPVEGHRTLMAAFAAHAHQPLIQVHVLLQQSGALAGADARAVQQMQDRAVPHAQHRVRWRRRQQPLDLLVG